MLVAAERKYPLLGAGLLLIASRAAKCRIEAILVERLLESLGLPHVSVRLRAVLERIDLQRLRLRILVHDQ